MLYNLSMNELQKWQDRILSALSGRIPKYTLGGGTALSKFYFQHRESADLDFFTPEFNPKDIFSVVEYISTVTRKKCEIYARQLKNEKVKVLVFSLPLGRKGLELKIDFIEDINKQIKPPKVVNGINVLSLEDIFLRKIQAIAGTFAMFDAVGRKSMVGGRQEAKDFYDLYFLSHTFMNLSKFVRKYGDDVMREALIGWFRSYSRMEIKTGLLELKAKNRVDYALMERHFKKEIGIILDEMVGRI